MELAPRDAAGPARENAPPRLPAGFRVVVDRAGSGKTSLVSRLARESDGALFAWKVPVDDTAETREAFAAQVARSRDWVRLGISAAPIAWAPDGASLLQPWIDGATLREAMKEPQFLAAPGDPRREALARMLCRAVQARTFVSGLNAANLVFDGSEWHVVDSGRVREYATPSEAWERQRADSFRKWTRGPLAPCAHEVDTFLSALGASLALPPPRWTLRRWWRLVRRGQRGAATSSSTSDPGVLLGSSAT